MTEEVVIRPATADDKVAIARHRVTMFEDMGQISGAASDLLRDETIRYLAGAIPAGEYVGWLACTRASPSVVVAGVGAQRRRALPHPLGRGEPGIALGRHAIVLNVYTEPEWRRRGIALRLMERLIQWARDDRLDRLVLHASDAGRPLYQRLGFVATNEMRFAGRL